MKEKFQISGMTCSACSAHVEKAVKEAEQYAEEDKKKREAVELRNGADQAVYQCEKAIEELGDKLEEADKTELQAKIDALKETLKGDNDDAIKAAQEELMKKFYEVSEKVYKAAAPAEGAAPADDGTVPPDAGEGYYNGEVH